jgi:hypothetical protein
MERTLRALATWTMCPSALMGRRGGSEKAQPEAKQWGDERVLLQERGGEQCVPVSLGFLIPAG